MNNNTKGFVGVPYNFNSVYTKNWGKK
jgi:hypothetical protein